MPTEPLTITTRPTLPPSEPSLPAAEASVSELLAGYDDVKAELVDGRVVVQPMPGYRPWAVSNNIADSLRRHVRLLRQGVAGADGLDYSVVLPGRGQRSFRPDASLFAGPLPANRMRVIEGPPTLAVEVRSDADYGSAAEPGLVRKRAEYFAAGTLAVWDVDVRASQVRLFRADSGPETPAAVFGVGSADGESAHAEPAVPGWSMPITEVFAD